ncbi:MAG: MATE family efflux transporter [Prevotella sp.]|nr:MATE family efflux transporter [Prevotella sp.]MDY4218329.1 MATE family efflux transporter [Prevotella sp.]
MLFKFSTYQNHYQSLTQLGIPIVVGQIGTIILGFADTLMVGHHSTTELGAAAFVNNMFVIAIIFSLGFSYGLTPIVGALFGQGNHKEIGKMLKNSLFANMLVGCFILFLLCLLYWNLGNLGQPEELLPLMRPYFIVNLLSIPFLVCFNTFKQMSDGITDTKTPMWILLSGNLLNIIGNYLLIYGKLGFPELGLYGAGLSTMFSRIIMACAFLYIVFATKRFDTYRKAFLTERLNKKDLLHLFRIGIPLSLQMGMEASAFSLSSVMVGWIGTLALAAHQVMLTISQFFYIIYYGMASAIAVRVSYFTGQKHYGEAQKVAAAGFHLILLIALCVSLPVIIFRNQLGGIFTDNQEVSLIVAQVILPLIIYQFGDGMQCAYGNAMRGISYVKPLMYTAFLSYFIICLPLGYLLGIQLKMGLLGIWFAFPFGLTTAGILYYRFFKKGIRRLR